MKVSLFHGYSPFSKIVCFRCSIDISCAHSPLAADKIILGGFMYFGLIVTAYSICMYTSTPLSEQLTDAQRSIAYFTPTLILNLGRSPIQSQLLSVPPYASAFVVGMISATISDYAEHRFLFAFGSVCLAITGFAILNVVHHTPNLQYAAIFMVASGNYTAMPTVLCWCSMNGM